MGISENTLEIEARISKAIKNSNRSSKEVTLIAVTKKQPIAIIQEYCDFCTSRAKPIFLGENYVQEFRDKKINLSGNFQAHMIGPLQSNKVKLALSLFDVIESVDSLELLAEINKQAAKINKIQTVFLQVNISEDSSKSGFSPELFNEALFKNLSEYSSIKIEGLMTITKLYENAELARPDFKKLKQLGQGFQSYFSMPNCSLSMGMSDDFEVAIEEGATHVRIGTALFGARG